MSYPNLGILKRKFYGFVEQLLVEKDGTEISKKTRIIT
jgi:hypothetical protein